MATMAGGPFSGSTGRDRGRMGAFGKGRRSGDADPQAMLPQGRADGEGGTRWPK